ncbi:Hpt domain-containing protein [Massilia sp. R2A-15]|uniref:hybrid sensor histidine kinase/response regulator n=1 Tax=Massilia sp. R2A-15 TaxID=3064278 RepID=UPI002735B6E8|nr:Hpt domain-containing protein [Massilia sp. R2A-15]WLI88392.1 Hpt domain-containing protein [Massilia sp. R2A-15]
MTDFSHAPQFDTGPLSWVIGEIRDALGRSRTALDEAKERGADARATSLQHAKTHLHQAHGALQMVDVEGVGLMTQACEQALERMRDGSLECNDVNCAAVADGYQAVIEYLDELLAGAAPQPARLFPYYRALQEALGAQRIHPSDLLFVDLSVKVNLPPHAAPAAPDYAACRARFEKALLPFLKSAEPEAQRSNALALQEAIALVEDAQQDAPARTFWMAMRCFAELVASGQLASDLYVKQLFGLINLQIRRLSQGQGSLPEAMLRDALFFIAAASAPSADAQLLRRAYGLAGVVPPDYDSRRYGRIDPQALKTAKDALAQTKSGWDRISSESDVKLEDGFNQALATLAGASEQLGAPALAQLLRELGRAASDSIASGRSDQFSMEMATAMLFVEHGLDQVRQLPADFEEHAEVVGARLLALAAGETPPEAPQWQGDLSRQIQQGQTVAVLAGEMKTGLRQVEKALDDYYADAAKRPALADIDPVLYQLQGALAILDQNQAMRAAQHVKAAVRALASGEGSPEAQAESLQNIAQNVGALGFFIDMLGQNFDAAKNRFRFDEPEAMFREVPFEKAVAGDTPFDVEPAPVAAEPEPQPAPVEVAAPVVQEEDAVEAELLEIFISEAQEVLAFVAETLPSAMAEPSNQETLTKLRRSFHTLKGSGRMVGLTRFADGGAAVERVMNAWLSDSRDATPDLLALLDYAAKDMAAWVDELAATGASARSSAALVDAAAVVQEGGAFTPGAVALPGAEAAPEQQEEPEVIDMAMPFEFDEPETEPEPEPEPEPAPVAASGGQVIEFPGATAPRAAPPEDNMRRFGDLEIPLPLYNIYLAETDELMRVLTQDFGEWRHEPFRAVSDAALKASHTLAGTSATVGFKALREVAHGLEMALLALADPSPQLADTQRDLLDEALECARQMLRRFAQGELAPAQPELVQRLAELRDTLIANLPEAAPVAEDEAPRADPAIEAIDHMHGDGFDDSFDEPMLLQAAPDAELLLPEAGLEPELISVPEAFAALPEPVAEAVAAPMETVYRDDLDPDLLPVFLEEAADLFPALGDGLRKWQQNPADVAPAQNLLRTLHTVKGSARMAGAMRLGQHTHEIETQIENMVHAGTTTPAAFDELLANYDHALLLLEQLQQPAAPALAAPGDATHSVAPELAPVAPARTALVRVRADILDRLVNQAGEVSITRSKLENQVGSLKTSLSDFSENLARLSRQLREVEMQAESQIASRMSISSEREFDPLEFDRFTRLQELTRMMAESVNDVASFHESLSRTVDAASADLVQQSRLTRDLQRDLMRVRMVPFSSLSERLFRIARQSAKELDKRVNLDIRGSAVEIDRSVLEQMAAPFEHLLRNAIVHGIESRERRGAAGKAETGELLVQASQQGNEVVIQFSDDGAGLDLARIRAKARSAGLLAEGAEISDHEAADLIFEPGFSTADSLTELAGRGVGMDVVRSEAQALGGRVEIESTPGQGARFTIHLPLTLAVTQVVLTASAGKTYALPSILVEQVLQMKEAALAEAQAAGFVQFQGQKVALHYLPSLLGDREARPLAQRSMPVMILKSGADRLAVQVDDVLGNREVVIKNIGPQLSRMIGIAGATVLGSGEIVLILNPVALSLHAAHHPGVLGAEPAAPGVEPAGRDAVIMVVDDSLTVRRVTQRLLEREGYRVILAKDGVDALEHLQETIPDLMLVDIEMPRMDGFDLTRNIRGNDSTHAVPIIMITSRTADKHRNYALDLGVNAYFGKPFQEDMLLAAIAGLLKREMPA